LIEERHGWVIAFFISALLFFAAHLFAAHLSHAYASLAFLPFFFAHCAILTLLVYFTQSILPSIVIHTASDFIVLPIQYGLIGEQLRPPPHPIYVVVAILCTLAAFPAFRQLAGAFDTSSIHRPATDAN
jgi:membrane protease YdiL (CAAX protease family)